MTNSRRQKLIELGTNTLADALLELAAHSSEASNLIEKLIATPKENLQRFKKKLSALKRRKRFIGWRESTRFSRELQILLQDLEAGVEDPLVGVQLLAKFYEADIHIFEMCDDSSGEIGDIFRYDAQELFIDYASRCPDKNKIANIILKVNQKDDYGIRDSLIDCANEYQPEDVIRNMISILQKQADKEKEEYKKSHYLRLIESLARQIKDAKLFEKVRKASWRALNSAAFVDIARVYLESGDLNTAHCWLKKVSEGEVFQTYERDKMLEEIYRKQGDSEKLKEFLFQKFRVYHSVDTLQALLDVVGHDKQGEILADEVTHLLQTEELLESDAEFLIAMGKIDEAEEYLLNRANQFNGNRYDTLLPLANAMHSESRYLVASLLFRSLLFSILERGYTKAYPHGVRYLKKLDKLAENVADWKKFSSHEAFKEQLTEAHGRKRSFWSKYTG